MMFLFTGDLDESESRQHFETWRVDLQNGRKPPVKEVDPETPWVGGKPGMFVKPPSWLNAAYAKSLKKLTAWRGVQSKYKKDYSEFEVGSVGEFGFRDKSPSWLDGFNGDIWQEQLSVSRKLARAFGTYRKTMWKLDPEVKLLACDGADKQKDRKA